MSDYRLSQVFSRCLEYFPIIVQLRPHELVNWCTSFMTLNGGVQVYLFQGCTWITAKKQIVGAEIMQRSYC